MNLNNKQLMENKLDLNALYLYWNAFNLRFDIKEYNCITIAIVEGKVIICTQYDSPLKTIELMFEFRFNGESNMR